MLAYVCKLVDENGLAALLATKRSAGVTPEGNLMNLLHACDKACKWEIHTGFVTQGRCHQESKPEVSVARQKGLMFSKQIKKYYINTTFKLY